MTTTYKARTYRSGDWWAIEITDGLPDNMLGVTQTKRLTEAEQAARQVVADLLEVEPDTIGIDMEWDTPVPIKIAQKELRDAAAYLVDARAAEVTCRRNVAAAATDEGLTMRETAIVMGISHQRVAQLLNDNT